MRIFFAGQWQDRDQKIEVRNPYDATIVDTVPQATAADAEAAIAGAVQGAAAMRKLSGYERFQILRKAADAMFARQKELGRIISLEEGKTLCSDERVRKISFTGSVEVGKQICEVAGIKRVTMELGSNSPLIVLPDADLNKAADAVIATGFANAGQVCISAQRVVALDKIYGDLLDVLKPRIDAITVGNPLHEGTKMGPMIRERDAVRVGQWVDEAVEQGAKLVCGGSRTGTMYRPTLVADVKPTMKIARDELLGPAVGVSKAASLEEAIQFANQSRYGLSAGLFTQDIDSALRFAREVDSGNLHINWGPMWRADLMPYGGLKESGFGKEGPKYAVQEMTEVKTVVIHGKP